eukprot:TRINITY_DN5018_c0_g1_i3.p1 TRINITY_DN5018_c0_g1~~TRINITY_DN5018_c0_g1_i3.p1  ORF type:complete len:350 (-),score=63.30 TRINITY_DN5018_c0_g1_i3:84-1133(-)
MESGNAPWQTEYSSQFMYMVPEDGLSAEDPNRFNVSGFTDENGVRPDRTYGKTEGSGYGGLGPNVMFKHEYPTKPPPPKPNYTPSFLSDTTPNRHVIHNPENNLVSGIKPKNFSSTPSVTRTSTPPSPSTQDLVHKHYNIAPAPKSIQKISFSSVDNHGKRVPLTPETKHDHHHEHHHSHHDKEHSHSRPHTPQTPPQSEKEQPRNVGIKPRPTITPKPAPIQNRAQTTPTKDIMDVAELSLDTPKRETIETPHRAPAVNSEGALPSHRCTHQWHSVDSKKPYNPSLECSMCHSSPLPNTQKYRNFDPTSSVETNPKFYRYLPASLTKSIPAAGVRMPRAQGVSLDQTL